MTPLTWRRLAGLLIAGIVFLIEQYVKALMLGPLRLPYVGKIELLPFFDLHYVENRGVSLGMLTAQSQEMRWMLVAMTGAIAVVVLIWMLRERLMPDIAALALVLGGALGNIYDRSTKGFVVDYADFHLGGFSPFIFNLADAAITIGVVIILARSLLSREKPGPATQNAGADNPGAASES